jgi:hypothetical protein
MIYWEKSLVRFVLANNTSFYLSLKSFVAVQQEKYKKNAKMVDILNKPA